MRASLIDRLLAWVVTGPVGRLFSFLADLTVLITRTLFRRWPD